MNYDMPTWLLIVEDKEEDYLLLEKHLGKMSFEKQVIRAASFDQALDLLESKSFDLVIADYTLGEKTGMELIVHIKNKFPYVPSILLTAGTREAAVDQKALQSGVHDYLLKEQCTAENLDRSIRYAIERAKVLKSLKESENRFRNLFENAVEYVFLVDSDFVVMDANKSALKLFGYQGKDQIIGKDISKNIFPKILNPVKFMNHSPEVELSVPLLNLKCFCILNLSLVDAERNIYQVVMHDITERKLNEHKEKQLEKQALTGKVARVIAHEIKNPLTNIHLSLLELRTMLEGAQLKNSLDKPDEFLDIIGRNERRINKLIEDLLNSTRFDTINLQALSAEELITDTLDLILDRIKLKEITVHPQIQEGLFIMGDKEKLVIALLNIFVNAIEAMEEKKGVLKVNAFERNNTLNIEVSDNGRGIPEADLGKLFEPFFTSKTGGSGLGLTATYNIIIKHDGSIKVSSKLEKGSVFHIFLPLKK